MSLETLIEKNFYCFDDVQCNKCEKYWEDDYEHLVGCDQYHSGYCRDRKFKAGLFRIGVKKIEIPTKIMNELRSSASLRTEK